jgi:L-cysteine S-thiosulfotransferase
MMAFDFGRGMRLARAMLAAAVFSAAGLAPAWAQQTEMREPLTHEPGNATRGRDVAMDRDIGNCMLCHALPGMDGKMVAGTVGPPLAGVGARLNESELRMRLVDSTRINPDTVMPAYHRVDGLSRVASQYQGKPVLTGQQVEDVVAYLRSLR